MTAEFDGKKIVVIGGSAGMGRQAAPDVIDRGGSAVILGRSKSRVDQTVAELTDRRGQSWGIAAEPTERSAVAEVQGALSEHQGDSSLTANAAGYFVPKSFLDPCGRGKRRRLSAAIFYLDDDQKRIVLDTIADVDASPLWPDKVVTEVTPASDFWEAEPEHQDYLQRYPGGYTCHYVRPEWKMVSRSESSGTESTTEKSSRDD